MSKQCKRQVEGDKILLFWCLESPPATAIPEHRQVISAQRYSKEIERCDSEMSEGGGCKLAGILQQQNSQFDPRGSAPSGYMLTMLVDNCHCSWQHNTGSCFIVEDVLSFSELALSY